ncbi:MAG: hypothetical protein WC713_04135 [Candidatus Methylomirabilota bacterium]
MTELNEDILDVPAVEKPPVNIAKTSTQDLKATALTSSNSDTITRELVKRDEQVMIKITSTERDKSAVFVGLNGRGYNIPRDIWVKVPKAILGILDTAKITEYRVSADPKSNETASRTATDVSRFAVSSKPVESPAAPAAAPAGAKPPVK